MTQSIEGVAEAPGTAGTPGISGKNAGSGASLRPDPVEIELDNYTSESIQVLEGLEAIRKRPGMYVGGVGLNALHHLVYECVDNSIDEVMAGYATAVTVRIGVDGSCTVIDDCA